VVDDTCARAGDTPVTTGVYQAAGTPLIVLVADSAAREALIDGDHPMLLERAFARHLAESPAGPFVFTAEIGPAGDATANDVIRGVRILSDQQWLKPALGRDVTHSGGPRLELASARVDRNAPAGFWEDIAEARRWAAALSSAGGAGLTDAMAARTASLVAQSSAWSHADWAFAERGRSYAEAAELAGRTRLESIAIALEPTRLAGTKGSVPVTISNGTDVPLNVVITASSADHLRVRGDDTWAMELRPQENFFEIPVDLQNALAGQLTLTVSAGELVLDERTILVHASYLDRLAIIGGLVLLMGGMLFFIIRRVRASGSSLYNAEEYTQTTDGSVPEDGS
jgi:hypothetical protein